MSAGTETFLRLLRQQQQAAPAGQANMMRQYQTPMGNTPPMALLRPTPPSAMPTMPKLSPQMQAIANRAAVSKLTPRAGQVGLPTGAGAAPQPSAPTMPQVGGAPAETTFGQRFAQPQTQALLGAAIAGAEASGYQDTPVSLGQVLGRMGAGAMGGYQAAEDRIAKQKAAQAPKIQVAGKDIYRVYPDGRVERLGGGAGASTSVEIKSEAGRYMTDDGRIIQAVLGKDGSLYEAGAASTDKKLDPLKLTIVDPYTTLDYKGLQKHKKDEILAPERTLKIIDKFATQIEAGSQGYFDRLKKRMSTKIKNFSSSSDYSEQEVIDALQEGTLTQLVGAARLELFGPGVMTEFEQEMARQVLAGSFDNLRKEIALPRLKQFRDAFYDQYANSVSFYNNQPIVKSQKMTLTPYSGFDWSKLGGTSGSGAPAASGNTTTGGNTWSVIN